MSAAEIDTYLGGLDEPTRTTLSQLRADILEILPDAEQGIAYGAPSFSVGGKRVAGFAAAAKHVSYLPHSGTVLGALEPAVLAGYAWSKGALTFPVDAPLPRALVETLISARLAEIAGAQAAS